MSLPNTTIEAAKTQLMSVTAPQTSPEVGSENALPAAKAEHFSAPDMQQDAAVMKNILQRFLQDFEYVRVVDSSHGSVNHPGEALDRHPHIQFILCSDDRKAMEKQDPSGQLVSTYLGRQIDRGAYILKKLGLETDEFYVLAEDGILQFDARVPKEKLPEGMSEGLALKQIEQQLQAACTEARQNSKGMAVS